MEDAITQLLKIIVFIVRKHWAHTTSYEDFVRFIGNDLGDSVLKEYRTLADSYKNATYITANTVKQFIKIIGEWMNKNTFNESKTCNEFTLLLDESTDEANGSELSLIARMIKDGKIKNHFLDLLQLNRGDAVSDFLRENELDIKRTRFAGMDGCSTMAGEHAGLKQLLAAATYHFVYIHCRNHQLALCFAHLIPKFLDFENFDSLLLNLYLLMKNSSVKQSIFEEIQQAYELPSLKLVKAAVTRWLSHGQAVKRVLDRYETLVASLDQIYVRKHEPAVCGLRDNLVKTKIIVALCFFTDVLLSTNKLQKFLQGSRLDFMEIPSVVNTLIEKLKAKRENPALSQGCYYSKLEEFFDISSRSEGARFQTRSDKESDIENVQQTTFFVKFNSGN